MWGGFPRNNGSESAPGVLTGCFLLHSLILLILQEYTGGGGNRGLGALDS